MALPGSFAGRFIGRDLLLKRTPVEVTGVVLAHLSLRSMRGLHAPRAALPSIRIVTDVGVGLPSRRLSGEMRIDPSPATKVTIFAKGSKNDEQLSHLAGARSIFGPTAGSAKPNARPQTD